MAASGLTSASAHVVRTRRGVSATTVRTTFRTVSPGRWRVGNDLSRNEIIHRVGYEDARVVRDIEQEFNGKRFRLVTRLDHKVPPVDHISTAHCLAFDDNGRVVLTLHRMREWTIPGGHLEPGESPEEAMAREALEEAGAIVSAPLLFAHEQIDPEDGIATDPRYRVPAFQVFYVARLEALGVISATDECSESRLFAPSEARLTPGWIQRNMALYEAALELRRTSSQPV